MSTAFVNQHMTRVLAAGADAAKISTSWLDTVDSWLTSQSFHPNLMEWTNPAFGLVVNGSSQISKVFGLGTTRLPRLGDYTPESPTNTTYSATGVNSSTPAWVNGATTAFGYYGSARGGTMRFNNIRRKHQQGITFVAAYQKSNSNQATLLAIGQSSGGLSLQNTSGAPGSAKFNVANWGNTWSISSTHGTTIANSAAHIIGGTFDGTTAVAYVEGVAGPNSSAATQDYSPLLGGVNTSTAKYFLGSGSRGSVVNLTNFTTGLSRTYSNNEAQFTASDLIIFDTALSPAQMASLNTLLRTRIGP